LDSRGTVKPINLIENPNGANKIGNNGKRLPSAVDILFLAKGIAESYDDKSNNGETGLRADHNKLFLHTV
jgi:hypothetical protein